MPQNIIFKIFFSYTEKNGRLFVYDEYSWQNTFITTESSSVYILLRNTILFI